MLGNKHPDTATTYNSIAGIHFRQGEFSEALAWFQKSLYIREEVLGQDHPDTATTLSDIAEVYFKQGDFQTARETYCQSYLTRLCKLGKTNELTLDTYDSMKSAHEHIDKGEPFDQWLEHCIDTYELPK